MEVNKKVMEWLVGNDTGISSLNIVRRNFGLELSSYDKFQGFPHDSADFGRCYGLLKACPELKIESMKGFNKIWDDLVGAWPELSALFCDGAGKLIFKRIQVIKEKYAKNGTTHRSDVLY